MIQVGQIYRDTYFDGKREECTHRTIRVIGFDGEKVHAETITDVRGNAMSKPRKTKVSIKTLVTGYELQEEGPS